MCVLPYLSSFRYLGRRCKEVAAKRWLLDSPLIVWFASKITDSLTDKQTDKWMNGQTD